MDSIFRSERVARCLLIGAIVCTSASAPGSVVRAEEPLPYPEGTPPTDATTANSVSALAIDPPGHDRFEPGDVFVTAGNGQILRALFISLVLLGCQPSIAGSLEELRNLEEEHLLYPGAVELDHFGHGEEQTPEGVVPARSGYRLGSADSAEAIEEFYESELLSLGWEKSLEAAGAPATSELSARAWRKGDVLFRFSIRRKDDPRTTTPEIAAEYETIFDISVSRDAE